MSLIPRAFINEVLARTDIIEIIDSRVSLRKKGNNYSACCPFHNEKTPSFTVSSTKQFYHCFGCGANGNAISFLMDYERLSFVEAIESLASDLGMEIPREAQSHVPAVNVNIYDFTQQVMHFYQKQLKQHPDAITYLKDRGLTGEMAKTFAIGYAASGWDNLIKAFPAAREQLNTAGLIIKKNEGGYYDRFRERIIFPIRNRRGQVIGFGGRIIGEGEPKYLNSPETPIFHKGSELYGLYEALQADRKLSRLVVVEGYMDVVALAQAGLHNVVATLGTATTADHIQRLSRLTQEIIFCFDGDRAGQAAAWKALEVAVPLLQDGAQIKFLLLPEKEDPDSLIRQEGLAKFTERLDSAISLGDFLFMSLAKENEMNTSEGKAGFAQSAMQIINKCSAPILQQLLLDKLAQLVRMDLEKLKKISFKPEKVIEESMPTKKIVPLKRSPMRVAIALLLQNPAIIATLFRERSVDIQLPGSDLLKTLLAILQIESDLNTAALLEYWREKPEQKLLSELAMWDLGIPIEGVPSEFEGIIVRLLKIHHEKQVEALMQKASLGTISADEKQTLQKLLIENAP